MFLTPPLYPINDKMRIIFGFPRSGTKLLADTHVQNGYHSFGEFFDGVTNHIKDKNLVPSAYRMSRTEQLKIVKSKFTNADRYFFRQGLECKTRLPLFLKHIEKEPTILTLWLENIKSLPELLPAFENRLILCTKRKNRFEHLLSRCLTAFHQNYNEEIESTPVRIKLNIFEMFYYRLYEVTSIQNQLIEQGRGKIVDFDELINGGADLGFEYFISSKDQHKNLSALIINLEELEDKFYSLSTRFPFVS